MNRVSEGLLPLLDISILLLGFFIIALALTFNKNEAEKMSDVSTQASHYSILVVKITNQGNYVLDSGNRKSLKNCKAVVNKIKKLWLNKKSSPWVLIIPENLNSKKVNDSIDKLQKLFDQNKIIFQIMARG